MLTDERLNFRVVTPAAAPGEDPPVAVPTDPREDAPPPATIAGNFRSNMGAGYLAGVSGAGPGGRGDGRGGSNDLQGRGVRSPVGAPDLSEMPAGYDFGANAVHAAQEARIRPRQVEGVAVRSTTIFTVRYRIAPGRVRRHGACPRPRRRFDGSAGRVAAGGSSCAGRRRDRAAVHPSGLRRCAPPRPARRRSDWDEARYPGNAGRKDQP